ncbi:TetR/AcrR family transcriptional regulator [uncultured Pseudoteredinibacter sp.]|uniref:helix-turn-helix domain-containing protein n=1 Tax=uncultured Pseudoteredinibacter sp. TaxID=1641701 RepID=UPI002601C540|nr:TetR/AcrR family transcriptional regulator [uncultured Pseudoteredinibacter sp.]
MGAIPGHDAGLYNARALASGDGAPVPSTRAPTPKTWGGTFSDDDSVDSFLREFEAVVKSFSGVLKVSVSQDELEYSLPKKRHSVVEVKEQQLVDVAEMVEVVRRVFGLTAAQVAKLVGVSRPTLYNHMSNSCDLSEKVGHYKDLYEMALAVERHCAGPISAGLKNVLVDGQTLLSFLKAGGYTEKELLEFVSFVDKRLRERGNGGSVPSVYQQKEKLLGGPA